MDRSAIHDIALGRSRRSLTASQSSSGRSYVSPGNYATIRTTPLRVVISTRSGEVLSSIRSTQFGFLWPRSVRNTQTFRDRPEQQQRAIS